jgi:tetratricopeptide (TPR) repeat protein
LNRAAAVALASAAALACTAPAPRPPAPPSSPQPVAEPAPAAAPAPPPPEVVLAQARALRAEGDLAGARARLEAGVQASPGSDEVRLELVDLLIADGRELDHAAVLLGAVAPAADARFHLVAARLAEARGDHAGAAEAYAGALGGGVADPDVRLRRALVLERLGRGDEAIAELEQVRAARPDDAVARSRLAERYEGAGRLAEAEAEHRWLAEDQPDRAAAWERLGRFYERAGRAEEARAALVRAREAAGRSERSLRPLLPSRR